MLSSNSTVGENTKRTSDPPAIPLAASKKVVACEGVKAVLTLVGVGASVLFGFGI